MKQLFVGNWKRYLSTEESVSLWSGLAGMTSEKFDVVIAPNHLALDQIADKPNDHQLAAQDAFYESEGAYTGVVSVEDLKEIGVAYVIVGHSERRAYANETDEQIAKKVAAVLEVGLKPILCVGESKEERDAGHAQEKVTAQVEAGCSEVPMGGAVIIAYEPIWAISKDGTGDPIKPEDAQEIMALIKELKGCRVLYGGSVKPENIADFTSLDACDGVLVGSASTKIESLKEML